MFRRWKVLIAAAALLVVLAGVGVGIIAIGDDDSRSPELKADLPPVAVDDAHATLSYLDGEGAALMHMHRAATSEPLKEGQRCEQVVQRLNAGAPPDRVAELMDGVEDEPLRAAFSEERLRLGVALTRCVKNHRAMPEDAARLRRATDLSTQRLDELHAAIR